MVIVFSSRATMTLGRPAPPPSSRWAPLLPLLLLLLPSASIALRRGAPVRPRAAFSMAADLPPVGLPDGWAPPEPKPLSVPEGQLLNTLSGSVALALRLGVGAFVLGWKPGFTFGAKEGEYAMFNVVRDSSPTLQACRRPEKPLLLYEYEPSPYCRKVREACALLDLRVTMLPCPGARKGFADELGKRGGKMQVPYLVDPNAPAPGGADGPLELYESDDIIDHLFDAYGPGRGAVPWQLRGPFAFWTCALAALARGLKGNALDAAARPDTMQMQPLELWGYEASPFVRPVRERLVELALPHTVVYCARGSANRDLLVQRTGRFQVPFLADPNTGAELFESDAIVEYLTRVYTVPA